MRDTVVCDKRCQCSVVMALFASSLSLDCSASRMSSKGLCLFSQWWREQKSRNFVKNHPVEGGFLDSHSIILRYSSQWLLTTSSLVLPIFSTVPCLQGLVWPSIYVIFEVSNSRLTPCEVDLRTNEVERVCHTKMLFDKITVLLHHLPASKGDRSALAFPIHLDSIFTWFSTLNGQSWLSKTMKKKKKKKRKVKEVIEPHSYWTWGGGTVCTGGCACTHFSFWQQHVAPCLTQW